MIKAGVKETEMVSARQLRMNQAYKEALEAGKTNVVPLSLALAKVQLTVDLGRRGITGQHYIVG